MSNAFLIALTWAVLLALTLVDRYLLKNAFIKRHPLIWVTAGSGAPPGTWLTRAGTLLVFLANIAAIGLTFCQALVPSLFPSWLGLDLPHCLNLLGAVVFVLYSIWGWLVVVYNPNYTPCYRRMPGRFLLATRGPYAVVRHPRYAAEAVMNIILFFFTGYWVSWVGLAGWAALYLQAKAEEDLLISLAGETYSAYRARVGMFFLK